MGRGVAIGAAPLAVVWHRDYTMPRTLMMAATPSAATKMSRTIAHLRLSPLDSFSSWVVIITHLLSYCKYTPRARGVKAGYYCRWKYERILYATLHEIPHTYSFQRPSHRACPDA